VLTELRVRDLAVIADATLSLSEGLNVLTGATGAGKSMLVDALALLLGERATGDLVRPGADRAVIEAAFELSDPQTLALITAAANEAGLDVEDGRLVVRREIRTNGPNRAWANGSPTTVTTLATLGRLLVDLHGQHEAQSLLRAKAQRDILDAFGQASLERSAVRAAYLEADRLRGEEVSLVSERDEVQQRADYLRHVAEEISDAAPKPGEDDALATEARRLAGGEELIRLSEELGQLLDADDTGVLGRLSVADRLLTHLEKVDPTTAAWRQLVETAFASADELARAVHEYGTAIDLDPRRLAETEERRDVLYRLMRKYGGTIEHALETGIKARRELDLLDSADGDLASLRERRESAERDLSSAAAALTKKRASAAAKLAKEVDRLLPGLGLPGGKFSALVEPAPAISATGADSVSFMVQLNVGLEPRPLAQVASGGELSRLMLALKVVLAQHDAIPTLVFDEVDQGIGGEVGAQVAEALERVGKSRQVLVITHLPQIAARATRHIKVTKEAVGGMTTADVSLLAGQAREAEVARLLGDSEDRALRKHAGELLSRRRGVKV